MIGVARRRCMGSGVPLPYDAEIEYLEGTGVNSGPYISTDILIRGTDIVKLKVLIPDGSPTHRALFSGDWNNSPRYALFDDYVYWNNTYAGTPVLEQGVVHELRLGNGEYYIDDSLAWQNNNIFEITSIGLFLYSDKLGSRLSSARIYEFKVIDADEVLTHDLIPVRVGVTGALYDMITGVLYTCRRSAFILGPDV